MNIRLLLAIPTEEWLQLFYPLLNEAQELICFPVIADEVRSHQALLERVEQGLTDESAAVDVILLDWQLVEDETPALVRQILTLNPNLRLIALLPHHLRQYRELVWQAGACNSIPKEHMDQEWLSSILCVMFRAMQREAKLRKTLQGTGTDNLQFASSCYAPAG